MPTKLPITILFIVLVFLGANLYFLIHSQGGLDKTLQSVQNLGVPIEKIYNLPFISTKPTPATTVPPMSSEFTSGNSRFSQGKCTTDKDCQTVGCSGEVCTNKMDTISTCEFSDDFPNVQGYNCRCVNGVCGWN